MDHDTLLAHPSEWVTEPAPTHVGLPHLTEPEAELYRDLVQDTFGHHVRLEQERVRYSRVRDAISRLPRAGGLSMTRRAVQVAAFTFLTREWWDRAHEHSDLEVASRNTLLDGPVHP
jgi:hypothetical protein